MLGGRENKSQMWVLVLSGAQWSQGVMMCIKIVKQENS